MNIIWKINLHTTLTEREVFKTDFCLRMFNFVFMNAFSRSVTDDRIIIHGLCYLTRISEDFI